ncbi:hypothetical protein J6590_059503 [Homalodisca vitripennis]|nr:hypothetical protein J6590_059503 [Homalodisca vitripennis]
MRDVSSKSVGCEIACSAHGLRLATFYLHIPGTERRTRETCIYNYDPSAIQTILPKLRPLVDEVRDGIHQVVNNYRIIRPFIAYGFSIRWNDLVTTRADDTSLYNPFNDCDPGKTCHFVIAGLRCPFTTPLR